MIHGGDIYSIGKKVIDFSSNINPLGSPANLKEHILNHFKEVEIYPDIKYRALKQKVASYLKVSENEVVVGNGAVEIINNAILMFPRIIIFIPCFIEYVLRSKLYNKKLLMFHLGSDFNVELKPLYEHIKKGDLVILGNPNNPTGKKIEEDKLLEIAKLTEKRESFLLLDETFHEFCDGYDSIELLRNFRNVIVLRAATKFFALPGIRLGYAYGKKEFAETYSKYELPWAVNTFAHLAANVIFDEEYINRSKEYIREQRNYMTKKLEEIKGIEPIKTDCNFMLIKLLKYDEAYIHDRLLERNILIRKCSTFPGLDNTYIRVAIKTREENDILLSALKDILEV